MKKRNFRWAAVLLSLVFCSLLLAACAADTSSSPESSTADYTPSSTLETSNEDQPDNANTSSEPESSRAAAYVPPITVEVADEEVSGDAYLRFADPDVQNNEWHILLKTETTVRELRFFVLNEAETATVEKVLYTADTFTPEKPLLISTYINDATANRGIAFVDGNGQTRYYAIRLSGRDGSLFLAEITPET